MDQSDDVSALSMDGASAIAAMGFARRLRKDFAEMQLGIPEDGEPDASGASDRKKSSHRSKHSDNNNEKSLRKSGQGSKGEELLEPFPKTYEEWQKKKEKKSKHKSKKHHKKSSSHSRGSSSKRRNELEQYQAMQNSMEQSAGQKMAPPIMEISIQSTNNIRGPDYNTQPSSSSPSRRRSDNMESIISEGGRSYPSVASTASSSHSRSLTNRPAGPGRYQPHNNLYSNTNNNNNNTSQGAMGVAIKRSLEHKQKSLRSISDNHSLEDSSEFLLGRTSIKSTSSHQHSLGSGTTSHRSSSYMSNMGHSATASSAAGHSTHLTGHSIGSNSQSHITIEDLHTLRMHLERAKLEEKQVLDIHARLEKEVETARLKNEKYFKIQHELATEMRLVSLDREHLYKQLTKLHDENNGLRRQLRVAEDQEDNQGLDDALDSMEAKIRQLRHGKMRRSKEKRSR